jgi:hypothetical protein
MPEPHADYANDDELPGMWELADFTGGKDDYCHLDDCCGPGSWCCNRARHHIHNPDGSVVFSPRHIGSPEGVR